ncbi:MAG: hypothetical protein DI533_05460 [Cereibacter sphaeroides]|uniref:5-bromo-4-chloroindolyl phosphate hydrolysis protein n=1 Tax=Cereibacter sphaeroides TaxID=1063 RepID=A0A2W5SAL3_CERSP|nr:MAG: hypothetical protein DI533_05460 [Cereibacter sphaeroides]
MAQRYGGKYSPQGAPQSDNQGPPQFQGRRRSKVGGRVNFLFFVPFIFVVKAFTAAPTALALNLAAFALLLAAAWLTREGIVAQEAYEARKIARRPAFPRKIFGSVLTGAGLFVGGLVAAPDLVAPTLFGILGAVLHFAAFGADPMRDKGAEGIDRYQTERVTRAVDEAERYLAGMKDAILRANDRALEARVDRFAATARALFRTVEGDPRDLTAARRDIGVFLMGARDATVKFADLYAQTRSATARADYESLLDDLETHFRARTAALLSNDHTDLDVEISVLRERLQLQNARPLPDPISAEEPISTPIKRD